MKIQIFYLKRIIEVHRCVFYFPRADVMPCTFATSIANLIHVKCGQIIIYNKNLVNLSILQLFRARETHYNVGNNYFN